MSRLLGIGCCSPSAVGPEEGPTLDRECSASFAVPCCNPEVCHDCGMHACSMYYISLRDVHQFLQGCSQLCAIVCCCMHLSQALPGSCRVCGVLDDLSICQLSPLVVFQQIACFAKKPAQQTFGHFTASQGQVCARDPASRYSQESLALGFVLPEDCLALLLHLPIFCSCHELPCFFQLGLY